MCGLTLCYLWPNVVLFSDVWPDIVILLFVGDGARLDPHRDTQCLHRCAVHATFA